MSNLAINFPTLVEPLGRDGYRLQPLLFPGPRVTHARYELAVAQFRRAIRRDLRDLSLDREELEDLLWYRFAPQVHFERVDVEARRNKRWLRGPVAAARFSAGREHYVCLPHFGHLTFMLPPAANSAQRHALIEQQVVEFLRGPASHASAHDEAPEDPAVPDHARLAPAGASVGDFRFNIDLRREKFAFEATHGALFESMAGTPDFNGGRELGRVGANFNDRYPDGLSNAPLREHDTALLGDTLFGTTPACVAIVGPRGAGKTTLVEAALRRYLQDPGLRGRGQRAQQLWLVDPLRVIAGMSVVGMWQRRWRAIIDRLRAKPAGKSHRGRADVLYVDNVVALFRIGRSAQNTLTLADVLKPHLERRELPMLVEATPEEWDRAAEFDRRFADLFEVRRLEAPPHDDALRMLVRCRAAVEAQLRCTFSTAAFVDLLRFAQRRAGDAVLPGAAARTLHRLGRRHAGKAIDADAVAHDQSEALRLSRLMADRAMPLDVDALHAELASKLVGQAGARRQLADTVQVIRARLAESGRPLASLLFVGPTGVGKTEAAKVLCDLLFTSREQLVRFDMNEYVDADAVARLIGDAHQPAGQLTTALRHQRSCVLLLDEIEKAHPRVHDLLLQLLDDGRLTDALGQTTDFADCVVVMTSNLGASEMHRRTGFVHSHEDAGATYLQAVSRFFRPEFINRIGATVVFEPLGVDETLALARLQLARLLKRDGFVRRTVFLDVEGDTLARVAREGFDGELGGRALKRSLETHITLASAKELVGMAATDPLLLALFDERGQLRSRVQPMPYARRRAPTSDFPAADQLVAAFELRAGEVAALRARLDACLDAADDEQRIELFLLKDRVLSLTEQIEQVGVDIDGWRGSGARRPPFKLRRRGRLNSGWSMSGYRPHAADLHAQLDIRHFFDDALANATALGEITHHFWLQLDMEYRLVSMQFEGTAAGQRERVALCLVPLVDASARLPASAFLLERYREALDTMDAADIETHVRGAHSVLTASGYGLHRLLHAERGVHLFADSNDAGMPVQVQCLRLPVDAPIAEVLPGDPGPAQRAPPGEVLRLYRSEGRPALVDLRSGLVCQQAPARDDWMLLLFAAGAHDEHEDARAAEQRPG